MKTQVLIGAFLLPILLLAQGNAKDKIELPSTKMEEAKRVKGSIVIKSYEKIGSNLSGKYSHTLEVDVFEFHNIKTKDKIYGLKIEVDDGDKYNSASSSFIDYEEIGSLISGLNYISGVTINPSKLKNYEAMYNTNGGLSITNFNSSSGNMIAISVGSYNAKAVYLDPANLKDFQKLISDGYTKIKSIK